MTDDLPLSEMVFVLFARWPRPTKTGMEDNEEEEDEERAPDEPLDDLGRVISDAGRGSDTDKERLQFEQMLQIGRASCRERVLRLV